MSANTCHMPNHALEQAEAACCRPSSPSFMGEVEAAPAFTWTDRDTWKRAGKNTLNCLIGCFIGDFGALIIIATYFPGTSMVLTMVIAMSAGLVTSILFESAMLRWKESFGWPEAFRMAISMSFISMLGMEFAANATDFAITGGTVATSEPLYWLALAIALVVGFLAPLPYNYWKLAKHGAACH